MSENDPTTESLAPLAAVIVLLLLFAWIKLTGVEYTVADDNIYHYLAVRWSEGTVPYRDFFHAHPPLHLGVGAVLYGAAGGFSLALARLLPLVAAAGAGLLLFRAARRLGPAEGVLACAVFLFAFDPLRIASHFVGASWCALWIALALERLAAERWAQAGGAVALASLTLLNAVPAGLGFGVALVALRPRAALPYALGGLAVFAVGNGLALLAGGSAYLDQVLLYHLGKSSAAADSLVVFQSVVRFNPWLSYGALAGGVGLLLAYGEARDAGWSLRSFLDERLLLPLAVAGVLASFVFLASIARVFNYYFEVLYVCIAPLAAFGLAETARRLRRAGRERTTTRLVEALGLVVVLAVGVAPRWLPEEAPGDDPQRASAWSRYLWPAKADLPGVGDLAVEVERRIAPRGTVFGESDIAPLVALIADRPLAFDLADTNPLRFEAGTLDLRALGARLAASPPDAIVGHDRRWLLGQEALQRWLEDRYTPVHWLEHGGGHYVLWVPR